MKANQRSLLAAIQDAAGAGPPLDYYQELQNSRGRRARWQVALYQATWPFKEQWAGLRWFICVTRSGVRDGKAYARMSYYISSYATAEAAVLARAIRGHWLIENQLHWQKDVTFKEDSCRISKGQGAENRSLLLNIAINLMRSSGFTSIKEATIAFANKVEKMVDLFRT